MVVVRLLAVQLCDTPLAIAASLLRNCAVALCRIQHQDRTHTERKPSCESPMIRPTARAPQTGLSGDAPINTRGEVLIPRSVLVASPNPGGRGGMSAVAAELMACKEKLLPSFNLSHVRTHPATGERTPAAAVASLALTARAAWRILVERPSILHLFVGARGSLLRGIVLAAAGKAAGAKVLLHTHSGDIDRAMAGERVSGVPAPMLRLLFGSPMRWPLLWDQHVPLESGRLPVFVVPNQVTISERRASFRRSVDIVFAGKIVPRRVPSCWVKS